MAPAKQRALVDIAAGVSRPHTLCFRHHHQTEYPSGGNRLGRRWEASRCAIRCGPCFVGEHAIIQGCRTKGGSLYGTPRHGTLLTQVGAADATQQSAVA